MFERTYTFWRRLVGRGAESATVGLVDDSDDRRVWVRFPADMETAFKPAGAPQSTRLSANVRNISLGGINLVASRAFQPGDMLTIELPGSTEETSCNVLACVVHCDRLEEGQWSLGCNFSRELSAKDLKIFGARRERHSEVDQREWKRFPSNVTATYQFVATDDQTEYGAKVINISATGVGLMVDRYVENGTLFSVELHNSAGTTEKTMLACVVHVTRTSATAWALGCNFIRSLSEVDLKALI